MKCCFCGVELENGNSWFYYCTNSFCEHSDFCGTLEMWQALIDGKAAQDALKKARELYESLVREFLEMLDDYKTAYSRKSNEYCVKEYMKDYDEKIASITTQEKK